MKITMDPKTFCSKKMHVFRIVSQSYESVNYNDHKFIAKKGGTLTVPGNIT